MNELARALLDAPPPPDPGAEERAWRLAQAAYVRRPVPHHSPYRRPAIALGLAAAAIAIVLTPAGGSVVHLVKQVTGTTTRTAHHMAHTPAPAGTARTLTVSHGSAYVRAGGHALRLGPADEATFSAFGHYVAAAHLGTLTVYAVDGRRVWSLREPQAIHDVRWSPDGLRVAYRTGPRLRIVDGNGEDPRTLGPAAGAALAWRPGPEAVLTYLRSAHVAAMVDVATGAELARLRPPLGTTALVWSSDGRRLVAISPAALRLYSRDGTAIATRRASAGTAFVFAAFAPRTHRLVVVKRATISGSCCSRPAPG